MTKIDKVFDKISKTKDDVRFSDVSKVLEHSGYTLVRKRGSHVHFRKEGSQFITIPVHNGIVKRVYVKEILKILGL